MVTLKCDVRTCTYNKENCCCKGDISVGGKSACDCSQTCCDSFKEAKGDQYLSALEHPSKMIDIDCEAVKCIYNSDYKCKAPFPCERGFFNRGNTYEEDNHIFIVTVRFNGLWQKRGHI